jgi:hypothetical protein
VLIDKLHQELLFLGVYLVNLRHYGTHNSHERFGGKEGFPFNLVIKGQNRDVIASRCIHGIKNSFHAEIDKIVWSLLQQLRLLQNAVDKVHPQDERNALPRLFLRF